MKIHILVKGLLLCGPSAWTHRLQWVDRTRKSEATCTECIAHELSFVNQGHPEIVEGEMWIANIPPDSLEKAFSELPWHTKRMGKTGINFLRKEDGSIPIFIEKNEFEESQQKTLHVEESVY